MSRLSANGWKSRHCAGVCVSSRTASNFTAGSRRRQNYRRRPSLLAITDNGSGAGCAAPGRVAVYTTAISSAAVKAPACLNQSRICTVAPGRSAREDLVVVAAAREGGQIVHSASHAASFGKWTKPFSIIAVWACMHDLVRLRLVSGDRVEAVSDQLLDQLGAGGLVLDRHDCGVKGSGLLAHRPLELRIFQRSK
jgi:hypothetical protein